MFRREKARCWTGVAGGQGEEQADGRGGITSSEGEERTKQKLVHSEDGDAIHWGQEIIGSPGA